MRFKLASLLIAVVLLSTLVGCGGGSSTSSTGGGTLSAIAISPSASSVAFGNTEPFTATGKYSDGTSKDITATVTWSSSATTIATISAAGVATPVLHGTTTITASLNGVSSSTSLTVTAALTSISLSPHGSSVNVGNSVQFAATGGYADKTTQDLTAAVSWSSTATNNATITANGLVAGVHGGSTTISGSLGGVSGSTALTVVAVLNSISISPPAPSFNNGKTQALTASGSYNDGTLVDITTSVTWTSSSSNVLVNDNGTPGLLLGQHGGNATITAATVNAVGTTVSGSATATVIPNLISLAISPTPSSMDINQTLQMTATGTYDDTSTQDLTSSVQWQSSAPTIATISSPGGLVTALSTPGSSNITALLTGIVSKPSALTVSGPTSIVLAPSNFSVVVNGAPQQVTATGNFADGSQQDFTQTAVWSSNPANIIKVTHGLVAGNKVGQTTLTATVGSIAGNTTVTVTSSATLVSIVVTPVGPAILAGGQQQFTATGKFDDGSTQDLTSAATWSSSSASVTMSGNGATGVSTGAATITATASGMSGTTALNVVAATQPSLSGPYTFTLTSADTRGPQFFAGSFTASSGAISGTEDCNIANGVGQNQAVSGSYLQYPDGRGQITFDPNSSNSCHPNGITLRFVLASSGKIARLAQFDGVGTAKGSLEAQDASAFNVAALNGKYVFRTAGIDNGSQNGGIPAPMGQVGVLPLDGAGNIAAGGVVDTNDFGLIAPSLTASAMANGYSVDTTTGRGTLQLVTASGTANFVVYVVDAHNLNLMQVDSLPSLLGRAELQSISAPVSASNLSGGYAFLIGRPVIVNGAGFDRTEFAEVGEYTFDGTSAVTGVRDDTNNTVPNPLADIVGAYTASTPGVNGRGTFDAHSPSQNTDRFYIFYAISANNAGIVDKMVVLQTKNGTGGTRNAPTGELDLQTATNPAALGGTYALNASELTASYSEALMQLTLDGSGNVTNGIADVSTPVNGVLTVSSSVVGGATYSGANPPSNPNAGRGVITLPSQIGFQNSVFYIMSPQAAWILGVTPTTPAADGSLNLQ